MATAEIKRVLQLEGQSILDYANQVESPRESKAWNSAIALLTRSLNQNGKIIVTGLGKSGKIADKIAATLNSTGSLAVYLHPTEGLHGDLGLAKSNDTVIALSQTGNTDELLRLIPSFKERKIPVIAICGNENSRLVEQTDVWLCSNVKAEACPHNLAPTSSTTLMLAMGDALALALMKERGFDAEKFAMNHPGGALGRRLTWRVKDLMHRPPAVACAKPTTSVRDIVVMSTQSKLGAVLIMDPGQPTRLLGIITDGDIRRTLLAHAQFLEMTAETVMTKNPITVSENALAQEALDTMENRPSQISVLPVMNDQQQCTGLIRIHDLVRSL